MAMSIGIDLGGTNFRVGLVGADGRVRERLAAPTRSERGVAAVLDNIAALCREVAGSQWAKVRSCGMGAPGPLDAARTKILIAPNMSGWKNVPIPRLLRRRLGRRVVLENDANCCAVGEHVAGAGRGVDSMVLYTLGTGVGGGIILGGKLWRGAAGGAAELGHMLVSPKGRACPCGRSGCVEAYASATAISKRYRKLSGRTRTAREIFAANDRAARQVIDEATTALATSMVSIIHSLQPERIVLAGRVTRAGSRLLAPLREKVKRSIFPSYVKELRIVRGKLGDDAGIVGAAAIAGS